MGFVFIICVIVMIALSLASPQPKFTLQVDVSMFKTSKGFAFGAAIVLIILAILYIKIW
jgi:SSS family solute:Na+ symporter